MYSHKVCTYIVYIYIYSTNSYVTYDMYIMESLKYCYDTATLFWTLQITHAMELAKSSCPSESSLHAAPTLAHQTSNRVGFPTKIQPDEIIIYVHLHHPTLHAKKQETQHTCFYRFSCTRHICLVRFLSVSTNKNFPIALDCWFGILICHSEKH